MYELDNILKRGYCKSPLGYDKRDWFNIEAKKLENKMNFYFKITKKDIIMTEEDEEGFKIDKICLFLKKNPYF